VGNVAVVQFDGKADVYRGPVTNATLEGAHARTVEVWALNPQLDSPEEAVVAWGRRGQNLTNFSFNYGSSDAYGALTAYGTDMDMAWAASPAEGAWHHLVITYDGKTVTLYDNGKAAGTKEYTGETAMQTA